MTGCAEYVEMLKLDWLENKREEIPILLRKACPSSLASMLHVPGKAWRTQAGKGVNFEYTGPPLQVSGWLIPRGGNGTQWWQVFRDQGRAPRYVGRLRLAAPSLHARLHEFEKLLLGRIAGQIADVEDWSLMGVEEDGHLAVDVGTQDDNAFVTLHDLPAVPATTFAQMMIVPYKVCINETRQTARVSYALLGARTKPVMA